MTRKGLYIMGWTSAFITVTCFAMTAGLVREGSTATPFVMAAFVLSWGISIYCARMADR